MKVFVVLAAMACMAVGVPVTNSVWTLDQLSEAIQDPNTSPALKPYLMDALNEMMNALFSGNDMTSIVVPLPALITPEVHPVSVAESAPSAPSPVSISPSQDSIVSSASPLVQIIVNINDKAAPVAPAPVATPPVYEPPTTPVQVVEGPIIPVQVAESPITPVQVVEAPEFNPIDVIAVGAPETNPIDVIAVGAPETNPIDVIAVAAPETNPIDVIAVAAPETNPIDVIAVGAPEVNPVDVVAVAAPEYNPIDVLNPIPQINV